MLTRSLVVFGLEIAHHWLSSELRQETEAPSRVVAVKRGGRVLDGTRRPSRLESGRPRRTRRNLITGIRLVGVGRRFSYAARNVLIGFEPPYQSGEDRNDSKEKLFCLRNAVHKCMLLWLRVHQGIRRILWLNRGRRRRTWRGWAAVACQLFVVKPHPSSSSSSSSSFGQDGQFLPNLECLWLRFASGLRGAGRAGVQLADSFDRIQDRGNAGATGRAQRAKP